MYNLGGRNGHLFSVKLCLVAIVTCPDEGYRSIQNGGNLETAVMSTNILNVIPFGRYRLPESSAETRLQTFQYVFQQEGIHLTHDAQSRLPVLAASAVWCRGKMFRCLARTVREQVQSRNNNSLEVTARDIEAAFMSARRGVSLSAQVSFMASDGSETKNDGANSDAFSFIGGNFEAKRALEDALALDLAKQQVLDSFGMGSPTGLLLFGPPGKQVGKFYVVLAHIIN